MASTPFVKAYLETEMKIIKAKNTKFIPASHEDPNNPGALKKVLLTNNDLVFGQVMMINWAKIPVGRTFTPHLHQDMQEVFIILSGKVKIKVGNDEDSLEKGDAVVVEIGKVHQMENFSEEEVDYIALGISTQKGGETVVA